MRQLLTQDGIAERAAQLMISHNILDNADADGLTREVGNYIFRFAELRR